jgi:DNA-directed RNA polymerase subunit K/omega
MPADFQSPAVLDLSDELGVDADAVNYRPGVRGALGRAARSPFDAREVTLAEREGSDVGDRVEPVQLDFGTPIARSLSIPRPAGMGAFQFVVLSKLRAAQLMRGCRPRVDGMHKPTITAQLEVSEGKVTQALIPPSPPGTSGVAPIEDTPAMVVKT